MSSIADEKKSDLRAKYKLAAAGYLRDTSQSEALTVRLAEHLRTVLPKGVKIGAFRNKPDEVSVDVLLKNIDYWFAFPRVHGQDLQFYHPTDVAASDAFVESELGILEPHPLRSDKVDISALEVLLIPGVAFDRKLTRLGRGRGFYDRTLENYKGLKIGVASRAQLASEELPRARHDVAMDILVTDQFILRRFDS